MAAHRVAEERERLHVSFGKVAGRLFRLCLHCMALGRSAGIGMSTEGIVCLQKKEKTMYEKRWLWAV